MISFPNRMVKTVFESVSPILLLSRLAGVCPLITKKNYGVPELVRSNYLTMLQVIILLISLAHLGFIPYAVINIEEMPQISSQYNATITDTIKDLSSQKFITKMANIVLISFTSILVRFSNLIQMPKHLPELLKNIYTLDRISLQANNRDIKRTFLLSVVLIVVSWPYQIYSILIVTTDSWMAFLMFYLNLYNNFAVISCEFQFVAFAWIIDSRFDKLNKTLKELCNKQYLDNEQASLVKLSQTRKSSRLLCQAFGNLNRLHGFQLMAILSGLSLNVLFGLYFSIFGGFTKNSTKTSISFQRISNITNEILWSIYYLTRFVFICIVAGSTTDKVCIFI
ncbi:unnamed protein product [Phyllotreta striolata]|uniref:Gustatory receptor n=1 Tax=Phyllotreta striolata TaxID=444603 RepID=A0A9N9TM03_PHYSR|nr:unnamed protein product [Phyllotreta striolata]